MRRFQLWQKTRDGKQKNMKKRAMKVDIAMETAASCAFKEWATVKRKRTSDLRDFIMLWSSPDPTLFEMRAARYKKVNTFMRLVLEHSLFQIMQPEVFFMSFYFIFTERRLCLRYLDYTSRCIDWSKVGVQAKWIKQANCPNSQKNKKIWMQQVTVTLTAFSEIYDFSYFCGKRNKKELDFRG